MAISKIKVGNNTHDISVAAQNVTGILSVDHGGTGNNLNNYPDGVFLCKQTGSNGKAFVDYYSKPLSVAAGGTNATTAANARTNLGFTYSSTAPTTAPSTGTGSVCFVPVNDTTLPIAEGGTGAVTAPSAIKNLGMYPVGSVYVTSTNNSPASYLGGTWKCFDKHLAYRSLNSERDTSFWTHNTTNVSSSVVYAVIDGHHLSLRFTITNKVTLNDNTFTIGTLNLPALGISELVYSGMYSAGITDNGNAMVAFKLDYATGVVTTVDINPKTDNATVGAGNTTYVHMELHVSSNAMDDSAVDKFFWRRTA